MSTVERNAVAKTARFKTISDLKSSPRLGSLTEGAQKKPSFGTDESKSDLKTKCWGGKVARR